MSLLGEVGDLVVASIKSATKKSLVGEFVVVVVPVAIVVVVLTK